MSYDPNVLQRAAEQLEQRRKSHRTQIEQRRQQVYASQPRLAQIDRELRATMTGVYTAALRTGEDPGPALAQMRSRNLELQLERRAILGALGMGPEDLDDRPLCAECGDSGWKGAAMCSCLQELCTKEQIRALSDLLDLGSHTFDSFRPDYYSSVPDPTTGSSPRQTMEFVYDVCVNYAHKFGTFYFKNLFLSGAPGLGKTFLSACIARTVSEQGRSVVYTSAGDAFARFEEQKFARDPDARDETRRYLNCDLLILDDLGCELTTQFVQSALYTIINTRLTAGLHTVVSSNLSMDEIAQRYSPQIASRLSGEYQVLHFVGEDIRQLKKNSF